MKIEKGISINYGFGFSYNKEIINILIIKWYMIIYRKN